MLYAARWRGAGKRSTQRIKVQEHKRKENKGAWRFVKQKSIKNIRQEFKDNGIFYTPPELAEKLKSYVGFEPGTVYDPTCGAGNLLRVFHENVKKYGQELDAETGEPMCMSAEFPED